VSFGEDHRLERPDSPKRHDHHPAAVFTNHSLLQSVIFIFLYLSEQIQIKFKKTRFTR
jgi:fucose permease